MKPLRLVLVLDPMAAHEYCPLYSHRMAAKGAFIMEYPIMLNGQAVGRAEVAQEGLYYRFTCRCRFSGEILYRIILCFDGGAEKLGVPVPERGEFCLKTRVPVKRIGQGKWSFHAAAQYDKPAGEFVPLSPEEPFRYLKRLQNAHLQTRDGVTGLFVLHDIKDMHPDLQ